MGICKCKKRSDEFCYLHKKFICDGCVVTDHPTCHIGSYVDWLTDSEFEESVCGVCKGELSKENSVRLLCYDLFHPECIDVYACSLPATTAQAGYACPTCMKPILPPNDKVDGLSRSIRKTFGVSSWAEPFLGSAHKLQVSHPGSAMGGNSTGATTTGSNGGTNIGSNGSNSNHLTSPSSNPTSPTTSHVDLTSLTGQINQSLLEETPPLAHLNNNPYGLAIRKPQQPSSKNDTVIQFQNNQIDDEEDKYNKKSLISLNSISRFKDENKIRFYLIVIFMIAGFLYLVVRMRTPTEEGLIEE
ncbi:hypothetical protein PPL_09404 [Heterostelium album PN500]|uniref:RING-type domain-containing protein n=1 Tax=Heterostelium pallidum (strain ATCC 26659 / Pp 5 / PN500) TaxID=670386 RepID=D3BLH0_HETP5|nr:hypothetical protein PPL_09404 [Heterostelium album PN500]EFA77747.1 hypothetical protein PPL_09404 [Heterostelium album PN500]|eukprot:XP_020429875.1 hypothetical protein PPL_09404 [Heterostelium album PN500]